MVAAGIALAFLVSFFCSLMEAALLSLTPGQLVRLKQANPRLGVAMGHLKDDLDRPITVILALNTAAHTIGATIAGAQFALIFGSRAIGVFSGLFTFLMLQYTELLPKSLGVRFNAVICAWMAIPLSVLTRVMAPVIRLLRLLNRPFESRSRADAASLSLDEVVALAGHARLVRLITPQQENIITQAAYLSKQTAADIMVPAEPTLHGVIRPVRFVPPDMPCHQVLRAFVDEHHLSRKFRFDDFRQALAFVSRVGEPAERENHHPDIYLGYGRVRIDLWTHKIGGLHENDFVLAAKIDRL